MPGSLVGNVVPLPEGTRVHNFEAVIGLVALAIVGATVAERLRTPAPSLLVVVGLGLGLIPGVPDTQIDPDVVLLGVLPPLLFAAAQQISLPDLRAVWRPVAALALGLVALTAFAIAGLTHLVDSSIGIAVALTLGAILASTDPVAVTALSRQLRLPERVGTIVQAESLFNDATSLVLFQVAVAAVTTAGMSAGDATLKFVQLGGGGALLGAVIGGLASVLLRRGHDATLQAALSLLTPYAAAVTAELLHVSEITAVIVAGLMVAARRSRTHRPSGRISASAVYDTIVFLLENAIFAVIGLELATFAGDLPSSEAPKAAVLAAVITATLLVVRALSLGAAAMLTRETDRGSASYRPWQAAAVVTWAGARGVVPLAATLAVPLTIDGGGAFPHRPLLLVVATSVVVATIVVQGTTLRPLVTRLGVVGDERRLADQRDRARHAIAAAGLAHLEEIAAALDAPDQVVDRARDELQRRAEHLRSRMRASNESSGVVAATSYRDLRLRLVDVESAELQRLRGAGEISAEVFHDLQRQLDLEATRLEH